MANSASADIRAALFQRVLKIAGRNRDIPLREAQLDVAEAIAHVRRAATRGAEKKVRYDD